MGKEDWAKLKPNKLASSRLYINKHAPYYNGTIYSMVPQPVENLVDKVGGPMGLTKHLVLLYDPHWIEVERDLVVAFGLAHEVLHSLLHFFSRSLLIEDPKLYNRAQDLVINATLRAQKRNDGKSMWEVPDWVELPEKYGFPEGLTTDQYYALLQKLPEEKRNPPPKNGARFPSPFGAGHCGGIAGNPLSIELEREFDIVKGRSHAEVKGIARGTAQAINQAVVSGGIRPGHFPGNMMELLGGLDGIEKIRWEDELASVQRSAIGRAQVGGLDYSMARPSRRSTLRGWPIPGLVKRDFTAAIIIDSSGSMSKDQLKRALTETAGVFRQTGVTTVWLIIVDAEVQGEPRRITLQDLVEVEVAGRGGTSFIPGVEAVEQLEPRPDVSIYFTDAEGSAPEYPPDDMEFIWGIISTRNAAPPASWGEVVRIE